MKRVELRPTVAADLSFVSPGALPYRVKCLTATVDGRVIAVGGLVFRPDGTVWISGQISEEMRGHAKLTLHRAGLRVLAEARRAGIRKIYATADPTQPRAAAWLERMGFRRPDDGLFVWGP